MKAARFASALLLSRHSIKSTPLSLNFKSKKQAKNNSQKGPLKSSYARQGESIFIEDPPLILTGSTFFTLKILFSFSVRRLYKHLFSVQSCDKILTHPNGHEDYLLLTLLYASQVIMTVSQTNEMTYYSHQCGSLLAREPYSSFCISIESQKSVQKILSYNCMQP